MKQISSTEIAGMIDHALLRPEMTESDVEQGCRLAIEYGCATACVRPCDVELARRTLDGSDVLVSAVIGFPNGHQPTEVKVLESEFVIDQGCAELDMVLNIGRLKSGDFEYVENDIRAVCEVAHRQGAIVKVIFENFYLTDDEKKKACEICVRAGADFVKTSTGFAATGATIPDLILMREACPESMEVKAAGGIRTLDDALSAIAAGATRLGTSGTKTIVEEARSQEKNGVLQIPDSSEELSSGY